MSAPHDETHEMHSEVATVARVLLSAGLAWPTRAGNGNCAPPATRTGHCRGVRGPNPQRTGRARRGTQRSRPRS